MLFQKRIIRTIFAIYRYIVLARAVPKLRYYTCRLGYIGLQNGRRAGVKSLLCLFRLFDWRERVRVQFNICSNQFFIGHSCSQVEVKTLYGRHYDLVDRYEIFISQMAMDPVLFMEIFSFFYHELCEHLCSSPFFGVRSVSGITFIRYALYRQVGSQIILKVSGATKP